VTAVFVAIIALALLLMFSQVFQVWHTPLRQAHTSGLAQPHYNSPIIIPSHEGSSGDRVWSICCPPRGRRSRR